MSHSGGRVAVALVASLLMLAGCTSSDDGDASAAGTDETTSTPAVTETSPATTDGPASSTTSLVERTASFRGVTADTIAIGATAIDFDSLRAAGLVDINRGDQHLVWQTLVDDINASGGVHGRRLDVHVATYDVIAPASAEAACIELTQDIGVFAVLSGFNGPTASVDDCIANQNETFFVSDVATNEQMVAGAAPWIQVGFPGVDRMDRATVELAHEQGMFDGEVVGVHALGSAAADRLAPTVAHLEELGIDVAVESVNDAPTGDAAAGAATWVVISERLREAGVTTLVIVGPAAFEFGQLIDNGLADDVTVINSDSALGGIGGFDDHLPSDYDGAVGPMGLRPEDMFEIGSFLHCVEVFEAATGNEVLLPSEVPNGEPDWYTPLAQACNRLRVFTEIATAAGIDLTNDSVRAVLDEQTELDVPQVPFLSFGPDKYDGNDGMRLGVFDSTMGLEGRLDPLTELMEID